MAEKVKNVNKNPIPNNVPFTSENQPSPEAKSRGWQRRREAQEIMNEILRLTNMSYKEVKDLIDDIKINPDKHTLREVKLANYLMERRFTIDYLDRHISKAPQEIKSEVSIVSVDDIIKQFDDPEAKIEEPENNGEEIN